MKTMRKGLAVIGTLAVTAMAVMAADEIGTMFQLSLNKGYLFVAKGVDVKATMYGNSYDQKVSTFTTGAAPIAVSSSISTAGVMFARNISTNCNAVVTATFELYPGECLQGRLLTTNVTVYAKTNGVPGVTTNMLAGTTVDVESIILAQ